MDIEQAAHWYEEQQSGLGAEFAREVVAAIDTVRKNLCPIAFATNERMFAGNYSTGFLTASCFESQTISLQF